MGRQLILLILLQTAGNVGGRERPWSKQGAKKGGFRLPFQPELPTGSP